MKPKATFYLDPENLHALEDERMKRLKDGAARSECGLSALVNEAIRRTFLSESRPTCEGYAPQTPRRASGGRRSR